MAADSPALVHPTLIPVPDRLEGTRVVLRAYRDEDADAVFDAIDEARDHLAPWMDWVHRRRSPADGRDYCRRTSANRLLRTDLPFGILDRADGCYLGGTGLHDPDWTRRTFEVGYWIRPTAEGQGFVSEAVRLLIRLAFDDLRARRLELRCDARNDRSRRVAERCGFVYEGRLRNRTLRPDGSLSDDLVFSLVPGDPATGSSIRS